MGTSSNFNATRAARQISSSGTQWLVSRDTAIRTPATGRSSYCTMCSVLGANANMLHFRVSLSPTLRCILRGLDDLGGWLCFKCYDSIVLTSVGALVIRHPDPCSIGVQFGTNAQSYKTFGIDQSRPSTEIRAFAGWTLIALVVVLARVARSHPHRPLTSQTPVLGRPVACIHLLARIARALSTLQLG